MKPNQQSTKGGLPEEIQVIIDSGELTLFSEYLQKNYEFTPQQITAFETELGLTVIGLAPISSFEKRAKEALQATDATVFAVLEDATTMVLTDDIIALLSLIEAETNKQTQVPSQPKTQAPATSTAPTVTPKPKPVPPKKPTAKEPQAKARITANPIPKAVPQGNTATIKARESQTPVPTGKMVGLKKEQTESAIKGMRTMRGDINRLRGPENQDEAGESNLTQPFTGK